MIAWVGLGEVIGWLEVWVRGRVLRAAGGLAKDSSVGASSCHCLGFAAPVCAGSPDLGDWWCGILLQPRKSNRFGDSTSSRTCAESGDLPGAASVGGV